MIFIIRRIELLAKFLFIVYVIHKQCIIEISQLILNFFLAYQQYIGISSVIEIAFIVPSINRIMKFFKIAIIGFYKILLDVGKVYNITIPEITIWTINARQCLKKIVTVQLSAEIKSLQTRRVKACQQHLIYNEKVYRFEILEFSDDFFTRLFIPLIVQNELSSQRFNMVRQIFRAIALDKKPVKFFRLGICFADNHTCNLGAILLNPEFSHIGKNVIQQCVQIIGMLNYLIPFHIRLFNFYITGYGFQNI